MTPINVAATLVAFAIGLAIGVTPGIVRNHLSPRPPVKIHYCYPHSTDEICEKGRAGLLMPVSEAELAN